MRERTSLSPNPLFFITSAHTGHCMGRVGQDVRGGEEVASFRGTPLLKRSVRRG